MAARSIFLLVNPTPTRNNPNPERQHQTMISKLPRLILLLAVFGAALLILGGVIARTGRAAGGALRSVV